MATQGAYLTFQQILANGLDMGGNPGLTGSVQTATSGGATMFLCALLDHLYRSYDWEFLLTTAPNITTTVDSNGYYGQITNAQLPSDYRAVRQIFPVNNLAGTTMSALVQDSFEQLYPRILNDVYNKVTTSTLPTSFTIDEGLGTGLNKIYLYPVPSVPLTFNMRYYRLPDVSLYAATPTLKVDYPDAWSLVAAVAHYAQMYDKENLQVMISQQAKTLYQEYRLNHRDRGRAGVEQLPFDEVTFKNMRQDQSLQWPRPT